MQTTTPQPDEPLPPIAASAETEGQPHPPPERPAPDEEPDEEPSTPEQLPLPLEVAKMIDTWRPRLPRPEDSTVNAWRPRFPRPEDKAAIPVVLPTVQKWVAATVPPSSEIARVLMYTTTAYALWGLAATGGLQAAVLLIPDNIEHYVHVVNERSTGRWKSNSRTVLRRVARAVNPAAWPLMAPSCGPQPIALPYEPCDEKRIIVAATRPGHGDLLARMAAVSFSMGAGMNALESSLMSPDNVVATTGGRLAVVASGKHPRLVPIRRDYTAFTVETLEVARATGTDRFFRDAHHASIVAYRFFGDRRADPQLETFSFRRARSTWLAAHVLAGTPLPVLYRFSGPLSYRTLNALGHLIADDLDPWEAAERGLGA